MKRKEKRKENTTDQIQMVWLKVTKLKNLKH